MQGRFARFVSFIACLRVEVFFVLYMFSFSFRMTPISQMVQDKICVNSYNQTIAICKAISKFENSQHHKAEVLIDYQYYSQISIIMGTLPAVFWTAFFGPWCDNYIYAKKILMIVGTLTGLLENIGNLFGAFYFDSDYRFMYLTHIPSFFSGGIIGAMTAAMSYVPATTHDDKYRTIRFMVLELCMTFSSPIASLIQSYLLKGEPWFGGGCWNYSGCMLIALGAQILALIWTVVMINERKDKFRMDKLSALSESSHNPESSNNNNENNGVPKEPLSEKEEFRQPPKKSGLQLLFNVNNLKDAFKTALMKRPQGRRLQLWLMTLALSAYLLTHLGPMFIAHSFSQSIYHWNPSQISQYGAIERFVQTFGTLSITMLLTKVIDVSDMTKALIGCAFYTAAMIVRGAILSPLGFWISVGIASFGAIASIGLKSQLSKIVDKHELGKVFSFTSCIEALTPLIATTLFTNIFNKTINYYAGMCYEVVAILMVLPVGICIWIMLLERHYRKKNIEVSSDVYDKDLSNTDLESHTKTRF